jgi:alpha-1,6-mannosyltransferase
VAVFPVMESGTPAHATERSGGARRGRGTGRWAHPSRPTEARPAIGDSTACVTGTIDDEVGTTLIRGSVASGRRVRHPWLRMTWGGGTYNRLAAVAKERSFGWSCLALVVVPSVVLFLLASAPGGTFTGTVPVGATAPSVLRHAASGLGLGHLGASHAAELAYLLIAVACLGFVGVLLASRHGGISTGVVVGWSVALIALASVGPPLFSHDLYGYAVYARLLVLHHANPYVQTPSVAPHDLFYPYNPWTRLLSPYGPVFTEMSAALVWVFRSAAAAVTAFKVLAGLCWVATVVLAARLGRRQGSTQACFAAAVIGLNPLVITRIVPGGHADALVALAVVAALTAWSDARPLLVTVFLTLATLVKVVAVIPLLIFLVASVRALPATSDRLKVMGKHLAIVVGLSIVAFLPFGYSPRVLFAGLSEGTRSGGSLRPPEVLVASRLASVLRPVGLSHQVPHANRVVEALFLVVAVVALLVLLRRGDTRPVPERVVLALMIFLLCSPWLEPWYLAWFIPLVGFVTSRTVIAVAVAFSVIASESLVTQLTSGLVLHTLARVSYDVYPILALGFLVVLLAEVVRPASRRTRFVARRTPDATEGSSGGDGTLDPVHRVDVTTRQRIDPAGST